MRTSVAFVFVIIACTAISSVSTQDKTTSVTAMAVDVDTTQGVEDSTGTPTPPQDIAIQDTTNPTVTPTASPADMDDEGTTSITPDSFTVNCTDNCTSPEPSVTVPQVTDAHNCTDNCTSATSTSQPVDTASTAGTITANPCNETVANCSSTLEPQTVPSTETSTQKVDDVTSSQSSQLTETTTEVLMTTATTEVNAPAHKISKSGAIALGFCIPILVIILSCVIYCNRKRCSKCKGRPRRYANLSEEGMSFGGLQNPGYDIDL